ncbi:MAG: 16S rRNA (guanine(966)-N(2))-methyltransferase RsmD [Clostridium sp.]|uniref:16S rRNA (guanine(966)-N(2))-methyltransferase RsmD n=1 Tax=Clostridium sp. TaxID=1506 RepID=UPI002FCA092A
MRIISGSAKGRKLKTPEGLDTRPTSDRVKQSVFNIILKHIFDARVLDLFGGTGNLGIESISRGCENCVFCEENKKSFEILKENVKTLGFEDKASIYNRDGFKVLKQLADENKQFDVIFLDPPYGKGLVEKSIGEIHRFNLLSDDGIIIAEYDNVDNLVEKIGDITVYRTEKYGRIRISFFKKEVECE